MSIIVKWPYENTMALAGFATGSKNAKEVHKVAGIKMKSGFTWMASAYQKMKESTAVNGCIRQIKCRNTNFLY